MHMAPGTLFGLVVVVAGILILPVSPFLTKVAARSQKYLRPSLDEEAFRRRNLRILRFMAGAWIVIGVGVAIFGLLTGR